MRAASCHTRAVRGQALHSSLIVHAGTVTEPRRGISIHTEDSTAQRGRATEQRVRHEWEDSDERSQLDLNLAEGQ